jgi:hypothetical protein
MAGRSLQLAVLPGFQSYLIAILRAASCDFEDEYFITMRLRRTSSRRHVSQEWLETWGRCSHAPTLSSDQIAYRSIARPPLQYHCLTVTTPSG